MGSTQIDSNFHPGVYLSSQNSYLLTSSTSVVQGSTVSLSLVLLDQNSNRFFSSDDSVQFLMEGGTSVGTIDQITTDGRGNYTAVFTGVSPGTPLRIQAVVNGALVTSTTLQIQVLSRFSLSLSTLSVSSSTVTAGNQVNLTLVVNESNGQAYTREDLNVEFLSSGGTSSGTFGTITNHHDGTYTGTFTGITSGTASTLRAKIASTEITSALPTITVNPAGYSVAQSTIALSAPLVAGGNVTVTLTTKDAYGNLAPTGLPGLSSIVFTSSSVGGTGVYSAKANPSTGIYTSQFSSNLTGSITLGATISGVAITGNVSTSVSPGSAVQLVFTGIPASSAAGSLINFTLSAKDSVGNIDTNYGNAINFLTTDALTTPPSSAALVNGVGAFAITLNQAGSRTLTASDGSLSVTSSAVSVTTSVVAPGVTLSSPNPTNSTSALLTIASCANRAKIFVSESASAPAYNAASGWQTCATGAGAISYTLSNGDGAKTLYVFAQDAYGNVSTSSTVSTILDTVSPSLSLTALNGGQWVSGLNTQTLTWTASDSGSGLLANSAKIEVSADDGSSWSVVANGQTTAGPYLWAPGSSYNGTHYRVRVTVSDSAGNLSTATSAASFSMDSVPPAFTAGQFSFTEGASTTNNNVRMNLQGSDNLTNIQYFCLKYTTGSVPTAPTSSDTCWTSVQANPPALTPSLSISLSNFYFTLPFISGNYSVFAFLKDQVGNISQLSNSGNGTVGTDMATVAYTSPTAAIVNSVYATVNSTPSTPPSVSDLTISAGASLYIQWAISDANAVPAGGVKLEYTTNDSTYTTITSGLNDGTNAGCSVPTGATGCYVWTNGSPSGGYYRVRVTVTNSQGVISNSMSTSVNSGKINFLAGNTNIGIGGSASSAVLTNSNGQSGMVIHPNGTVYYLSGGTGVMKIDPLTGVYSTFIPQTGAANGDGGAASSATLNYPLTIALDSSNRLLIWDYNKIRRVDLNLSTPTITTIIGGGADSTSLGIAGTASKLLLNGTSNTGLGLFPLPNGDLVYTNTSEYGAVSSAYRYRRYSSATGLIDAPYAQLTGTNVSNISGIASSQDLSQCNIYNFVPVVDSTTFQLSQFIQMQSATTAQTTAGNNCYYNGNYSFQSVYNVSTGAVLATLLMTDDSRTQWHLGKDGNTYYIGGNGTNIKKWYKSTSTWTVVAGSASKGTCADGTAATSCSMTPANLFVASNGTLYFTELGRIRYIDSSNTVKTLTGQSQTSGDGALALNARLGSVGSVDKTGSNRYVFLDTLGYKIREFTVGSNVSNLAGTGVSGSSMVLPTATAPTSINVPMNGPSMATNPSTGDIYFSPYRTAINKYNRSTGFFEHFAGGGSTAYDSGSAAGLLGTQVNYSANASGNTVILGFDGTNVAVVQNSHTGVSTTTNVLIQLISTTTGVVSSLAGMNGTTPSDYSSCIDTSAGGSTSTCQLPNYYIYGQMAYDATHTRWIYESLFAAGIKAFTTGGNVSSPYPSVGVIAGGLVYVENGNHPSGVVVYCKNADGKLYLHDGTSETALSWSIPSVTCNTTSGRMVYDSARNSIIFSYVQNGLYGIAEYTNP